VDSVLLERERDLQARLNSAELARTMLLGSKFTPQQLAAAEKKVNTLSAEYEEVRAKIRSGSPRYSALKFPQPLGLAEIQSSVLDPDTLLLEYALGPDHSFLWAVTADSLDCFELPARGQVEQSARRFREALASPTGNVASEAAKEASRVLLSPVASKLGNKRLLIVADGALQYLPFAALPDPEDFEQPLIVKHEVVSVPSASTVAVLRRELSNRNPPPKKLAVLADPVFNRDDSRVMTTARRPVSAAPPAMGRGLERAITDFGISGTRLNRLPGTRREAAGIIALVGESERKQALDFDASVALLNSLEIKNYRIVHLATHGFLNTAHPGLSGLALSLVDKQGNPVDGFLRLHEIYNLRLAADLVVLSACQTGLGKEVQGEGLVGLTRGFMYAGAPRVVASLWKVDDSATAELMRTFYSAMLGENRLSVSAALRQAQVAMWKTRRFQAPYYWAAFVLQGDWK
jgi:CHAT domain-containing protein